MNTDAKKRGEPSVVVGFFSSLLLGIANLQ